MTPNLLPNKTGTAYHPCPERSIRRSAPKDRRSQRPPHPRRPSCRRATAGRDWLQGVAGSRTPQTDYRRPPQPFRPRTRGLPWGGYWPQTCLLSSSKIVSGIFFCCVYCILIANPERKQQQSFMQGDAPRVKTSIHPVGSCATLVLKRIWEVNPDFRVSSSSNYTTISF